MTRSAFKKAYLFLGLLLPVVFCYLLITFISTAPAVDAEKGSIPSYGKGPQEVYIFSDYFCPPCQALEPKLEPVLEELYAKGSVKITFVDTPMHRETPLFAKFYLYAAATAPDYRAAVRARQVLFALAVKENVFWMDERIEETFQKEKIAYTAFDVHTVQPELNRLISQYRIDATPSCVILSPGAKARKYTGAGDILKGLATVRAGVK
ncbi:MAG TPA: DsbA family protein [Syntrophales bacterium]|nr:DsbA family protein [Syntrophales bacterium]